MLPVHIAVILLFLLLGLLFRKGKGGALIAGYNTMSEWEKTKIDEGKLCRFMARFMFVLAACWAVAASGTVLHSRILFLAGTVLFFAAAVIGAVLANTGDRFKR